MEASTRVAVLRLLCGGARTARQLAEELNISANAVRKILVRLEAEGLVSYDRVTRGVGKPSHEYAVTLQGEQSISEAYLPLLLALLQELRQAAAPGELEAVLRAGGARLSSDAAGGTLRQRLESAVAALNQLGAAARLKGSARLPRIECTCCAIAAVVVEEPLACKAVEAMISASVGVPVVERCDRRERPMCRFELGPARRI